MAANCHNQSLIFDGLAPPPPPPLDSFDLADLLKVGALFDDTQNTRQAGCRLYVVEHSPYQFHFVTSLPKRGDKNFRYRLRCINSIVSPFSSIF